MYDYLDDRQTKRLKELVPYKILAPDADEIIEELDRLNNIINELEKWLEDNLGNCRTNQNYTSNQIYNLKEDAYYRCLNRLKELKEDK